MNARGGDRNRQRIVDAVARSPGIHKTRLCQDLGLAWGTVSHHVKRLREQERLRTYREGRTLRLYPPEVPAEDLRWLAMLQADLCANLLENLRYEPGRRLTELARELGVSRKVMRRHLDVLVEEGILRPQGEFQRRYHVDAEAVETLGAFFPEGGTGVTSGKDGGKPGLWSGLLHGDLSWRR